MTKSPSATITPGSYFNVGGAQCTTDIPFASHPLRKRTPTTSARFTSSKSKTADAPHFCNSVLTWSRCSDRSSPLSRTRARNRSILSVMNCQLPTALSVPQWMGHFKRLKTKGLESSFLLNHQEFLISQDLTSGFRATDGRE